MAQCNAKFCDFTNRCGTAFDFTRLQCWIRSTWSSRRLSMMPNSHNCTKIKYIRIWCGMWCRFEAANDRDISHHRETNTFNARGTSVCDTRKYVNLVAMWYFSLCILIDSGLFNISNYSKQIKALKIEPKKKRLYEKKNIKNSANQKKNRTLFFIFIFKLIAFLFLPLSMESCHISAWHFETSKCFELNVFVVQRFT